MSGPVVGRILLDPERTARMADEGVASIAGEGLRSAFAVSSEHVLTAWHCVRDAAMYRDRLWFRLRHPSAPAGVRRYVYIPVTVLEGDEKFDVAVLSVDGTRLEEASLSEGETHQLLARSVIPLGVDVSLHEQVWIMGFPANASSADSDTLLARIVDPAITLGEVVGLKLMGEGFAAVDPIDPRGLSGGPVLKWRDSGEKGTQVAVGIVRGVPVGRYRGAASGGGLIATRIEDIGGRLAQIAAALPAAGQPAVPGTDRQIRLRPSDVTVANRPDETISSTNRNTDDNNTISAGTQYRPVPQGREFETENTISGGFFFGPVVQGRDIRLPVPTGGDVNGQKVAGHVFISYVREDSDRVDQLQRALHSVGIPVWRDTADLWPGEDWRARIRDAITGNALVFLACFSSSSLARNRSYQNEELVLAIEQLRLRPPERPWLIPVRFDDCEIPDRDIGGGRTLTAIQRVDLFGNRYDEGARRLVEAILRILGQDSDSAQTEVGHLDQPAPDHHPDDRFASRMRERAGFVATIAGSVITLAGLLEAIGVPEAQYTAARSNAPLNLWGNVWSVAGLAIGTFGLTLLLAAAILYASRRRAAGRDTTTETSRAR